MRKTIIYLATALSLFMTGCEKSGTEGQNTQKQQQFGEETVLGKKLRNPYAVDNMQAVCKESIEPNFLYIRFLPESDYDVCRWQRVGVRLYDYPLDYELSVIGKTYHDPAIATDAFTWQYAVVPADFRFPDAKYELLERCYIPDDLDLEKAAFLNAGYDIATKAESASTALSAEILVENDVNGTIEGVRGVKISFRTFVKEIVGYTDENGFCSIKNDFVTNPELSVVFDNENSFSIWKDLRCINAVSINLGNVTGATKHTFKKEDKDSWTLGIINNSAYDYHGFCEREGFKLPPEDLKIWVWSFVSSSSASMIRRVNGYEGGKITKLAGELIDYLSEKYDMPYLNMVLPDLTVGTNYIESHQTYRNYYKTTWHELTHSSHYSQVGEQMWADYIDYIVRYGAYGDGTAGTVGMHICDLGESWAYANERYRQKEMFGVDSHTLSSSEWFFFHYDSIFKVLDQSVLTRKQMYDCLTIEVKSYDSFKAKLIETYPEAASRLQQLL